MTQTDDEDDFIKEGEKRSKTVRLPSSIWNPIVTKANKHRCKTQQVIVSVLADYFDNDSNTPFLPYQCPVCLHANEPMAKYCIECGTPLSQEATKEMQDIRAYINKIKEDPAVMAEYSEWLRTHKKRST